MDGGEALNEVGGERSRHWVILRVFTVGFVVVGAPFVPMYLWIGIWWVPGLLVLVMAMVGVTHLWARRSGRPDLALLIDLGFFTALLVASNISSGGLNNPNFAWLFLVPILAALVGKSSAAVGFTGVVAVLVLGFFGVEQWGPGLTNQTPEAFRDLHGVANRLFVVLCIGIVMWLLDWQGRERLASIARARDEAELASGAKTRFLSVMSHELRTPLNAILGYAELLAETPSIEDDPEAIEDLTRIQDAAMHLTRIVGDLLDVTDLESGQVPLASEVVAMRAWVEERVEAARGAIESNGNALVVELGEEVDVSTDPLRLGRVVEALLSNAGKFCRDGEVTVKVGNSPSQWCVEVSDTGIGIEADVVHNVFEPFTQVHGELHAEYGGVGLSLALSRRLALQLGGDLTATSKLGQGSQFRLCIPA